MKMILLWALVAIFQLRISVRHKSEGAPFEGSIKGHTANDSNFISIEDRAEKVVQKLDSFVLNYGAISVLKLRQIFGPRGFKRSYLGPIETPGAITYI